MLKITEAYSNQIIILPGKHSCWRVCLGLGGEVDEDAMKCLQGKRLAVGRHLYYILEEPFVPSDFFQLTVGLGV